MKTFKKLLLALLTIALLSSVFLIAALAEDGELKPGNVAEANAYLAAAEAVTDVYEKSGNIRMFDEYMSSHFFDEGSEEYLQLIARASALKTELTESVLALIEASDAYAKLTSADFDALKLSEKKQCFSEIYQMLLGGYVDEENADYVAFRQLFDAKEAEVVAQYNAQKNALLQNAPVMEYFYPETSQLFFYDFEDGKTIPKYVQKGDDKFIIEPNGAPYSNGEMTSFAPSGYRLHMDGDGDYKTNSYISAVTFNCENAGYEAFVLEYDIFYKGDPLQIDVKLSNTTRYIYTFRQSGIRGFNYDKKAVFDFPELTLPLNTWSHLSIVYNRNEQMLHLYIDYEHISSHVYTTDPAKNITQIQLFSNSSMDSTYIDNIQGYYGTQPRQLDYANSLRPEALLAYYYGVYTDSNQLYEERVKAREWFESNYTTFGTYTYQDGERVIDYADGYSEETVGATFRGFLDYDLEKEIVLDQVAFLLDNQNSTADRVATYESVIELMEQKEYIINDAFNTAYENDTEIADAVNQFLQISYTALLKTLGEENYGKLKAEYDSYYNSYLANGSSYTTADARETAINKMNAFIQECGEKYIAGHEEIVANIEVETAKIARDRHVAQLVGYIDQYFKAQTPVARFRWHDRILANLEYEGKSILTFTDLVEIADESNGIPARLAEVERDFVELDKKNNSSQIVGKANLIQNIINEMMMVEPTDERYPTEVLAILRRDGEIRNMLYETYRSEIIQHIVVSDTEVFNHYVAYFYDEFVVELYKSDLEVQQYFYNKIRTELIENLISNNNEVCGQLARALGVPSTQVTIEAVMDLLAQDDVTNTYVNGFISTDIADAAYLARVLDMAKNDVDAKAIVDSKMSMSVTPTTDSFLEKIYGVFESTPSEQAYLQAKIDGVYLSAVMTLLAENSELKESIDARLDPTSTQDYATQIENLLKTDAAAKDEIDCALVEERFEKLLERAEQNSAVKRLIKTHLVDLLNYEVLESLIVGEDFDENTVDYLRLKLGLQDGEQITMDAVLQLIETDSEVAVYLELRKAERLSERAFAILESNTELNTVLRANVEAIRAILNSGNYVTDYDGLNFALDIFKIYNDYYYAILQDEHIAELSDALARYDAAAAYIDRCGIYLYMKDYIENNDIDFENYSFFNETRALLDEYYHNLYDIPEGSEYSKEEQAYIDLLKTNTEKFIAAVDNLYARMNYQQLTQAIMEIREYYYHISIETSAARDRVAIFETYEQKWLAWNEANEEFIKIVGELKTADTMALRFGVLTRACALLEKVDENYPGTKEALAVYNQAAETYEAQTGVVNRELAEAADILCAQRAPHSAVANVVAVLRKKYY